MQGWVADEVTHEALADIMADSMIDQEVDIGVASVKLARHPVLGNVVCISGCDAKSAIVRVP